MRYYPINLDIQNRHCLVIGGGKVATRKVATLLKCGARVTVVSPEATDRLQSMEMSGSIRLINRPYRTSDLGGMFLVIGATDNKELNRQIYQDAENSGRLCNIADQPDLCNFILPSIVNRGDLILGISTSGKSPAFAKKLRKDLEKIYGDEYVLFLQLMGALREKLLSRTHEPEAHKAVFEQLIERGLLDRIRAEDKPGIDALLYEVLGKGFECDQLLK
jgi:precorrin-2 dehydrogenase / sirohydrochlorin ferrochelatase